MKVLELETYSIVYVAPSKRTYNLILVKKLELFWNISYNTSMLSSDERIPYGAIAFVASILSLQMQREHTNI